MFEQIAQNFKLFTQFYGEFKHASHDAASRYVDIAQAGEAIEERHGFKEHGNIPWSDFSETETRIYKAYLSRLNSDNPPNLKGWIKKLEIDYRKKILKGWLW